jgi:hypothetical protein
MWRKLNLLIACWGIKKAARIIDAGCLFWSCYKSESW